MIYNLFNRSRLMHNSRLYKKAGLNKFYFSPVSSKDFENVDEQLLIPKTTPKKARETELYKKLSDEDRASIDDYPTNGYAILKGYLDSSQVDAINNDIADLIKSKAVKFRYGNKIMFAFKKSKALKSVAKDPLLDELLSALMGDQVKLFQSINFLSGSEQDSHSDSIHMTTFPQGGLLGVWVALEDIDSDNGPLHYYPGSHTLPYYMNKDYDNEGNLFMIGKHNYDKYEEMIAQKIKDNQLEKKTFTAKAGDLLIWHANLLHGGERHTNKQKTRKSVVFHYYAENRICYHEITQRPALI